MFDVFRRKRRARKLLKEAGFVINTSQHHRDLCPFCTGKAYAVYALDEIKSPAGEIFRHRGSDIAGWGCMRCSAIWSDGGDHKKPYKLYPLQEWVDLHHVREIMTS